MSIYLSVLTGLDTLSAKVVHDKAIGGTLWV